MGIGRQKVDAISRLHTLCVEGGVSGWVEGGYGWIGGLVSRWVEGLVREPTSGSSGFELLTSMRSTRGAAERSNAF